MRVTLAVLLLIVSGVNVAAVVVCGIDYPTDTTEIVLGSEPDCAGTTIPSLAPLTQLADLQLYQDWLTGTIPDLSANTVLEQLFLNNNQLTGEIPDLSANAALKIFNVAFNFLSGPLPQFTNNLLLSEFAADHNHLSGTLPRFSTNSQLYYLLLSNNQLSGTLHDFSANPELVYLILHDNQFTGAVPNFNSNSAPSIVFLAGNDWSCPLTNYSHLPQNDFTSATCVDPPSASATTSPTAVSLAPSAIQTSPATAVPTASGSASPTAVPSTARTLRPVVLMDDVIFKGIQAWGGTTASLEQCRVECDNRAQCNAATRWEESGWCIVWEVVTGTRSSAKPAVSWIVGGDACPADPSNSLPAFPPGTTLTRPCEPGATGEVTFECGVDLQWHQDAGGCVYECKCRSEIAALRTLIESEFAALRAENQNLP